MTVNVPDDCVVMPREKLRHIRDELSVLKTRVMEGFSIMEGLVQERDEALKQLQQSTARIQELEATLNRWRDGRARQDNEIQQDLGKALGYPWFKDDQKNFPGATEAHGVCVGDHLAASIAAEAATRIRTLERDRDEARARCRALDDVETDLWMFAGEVMRSEVPKEIRDKAADLVRKYDTLNPPDLPWLDERPTSAPENPPDLFAPCYSPPNWIDPSIVPPARPSTRRAGLMSYESRVFSANNWTDPETDPDAE